MFSLSFEEEFTQHKMILTSIQKHFLLHCHTRLANEEHPHITVVWQPSYGCTTVNIILAKSMTGKKPGAKIAYICQTDRESSQALVMLRKTLPNYRHDEDDWGIVILPNGSQIQFISVYSVISGVGRRFDFVILDKVTNHISLVLNRLQTTPVIVNRGIDQGIPDTLPALEYSKRTCNRARVTTLLCKAFEKEGVTRDIALDVVRYFL